MTGPYSFEMMGHRLDFLWKTCIIRPENLAQINKDISLILQQKNHYLIVEEKTGVPWYLIGALHIKECSGRMSSCLHNGEPWSKVTTLIPKGRGPFNSWVESAVDAMIMKKALFPEYIDPWTIERVLYFALCYNGLGYNMYHPDTNSPYLWSCTSNYLKGGYVADGIWDSDHVIKNTGVAAILKVLLAEPKPFIGEAPPRKIPEPIKQPVKKISFWTKIKNFFA